MNEPAVPFGSLFVALPTPFDEQGHVEGAALDTLLDYLKQQSVPGLALLTEAAEDPYLLPDERRDILSRVADKMGGGIPTLVNVSAPSTREAVDLARFAESKEATGILLGPLGIPGLGYRELYRHVDRVARAISIPVFLTVRPHNAVDGLSKEEQATLAQHPALAGAFLPQPATSDIKVWARRFRKRDGAVFSGCALSFPAAAKAGAMAAICGLSVLALDPARKLLEAVTRGDVDAARKIVRRTDPAVSYLGPPRAAEDLHGVDKLVAKLAQRPLSGRPSDPWVPQGLIKAGLELQGHKTISARVRPPSEQPSRERVQKLAQVLKGAELLS